MKDFRETYAGYIAGDSNCEFYTAEQKWVRRIKKWKEDYPDAVDIFKENKDGSILAYLPVSWFKISPKKRSSMTDEQKQAASERLRNSRQKQ